MANKIQSIKPLDKIIRKKKRETKEGNIELGYYWSLIQIYSAIKMGISIDTICQVASKIQGRLDRYGKLTDAKINPITFRKYLNLTSTPNQYGHTVVTKMVSKGVSEKAEEGIRQILMDNNSFGDKILSDIVSTINKEKGQIVDRRVRTMGTSDFNAVLALCIEIGERQEELKEIASIPNSEHVAFIIKTITKKREGKNAQLGFKF